MRGFGRSSYNNQIQNLEDLSEDIMEFADKIEWKTFVIMGWSTGGGVGMLCAIKHPQRIVKLVLLASIGA